jgi:hypothetical protein
MSEAQVVTAPPGQCCARCGRPVESEPPQAELRPDFARGWETHWLCGPACYQGYLYQRAPSKRLVLKVG